MTARKQSFAHICRAALGDPKPRGTHAFIIRSHGNDRTAAVVESEAQVKAIVPNWPGWSEADCPLPFKQEWHGECKIIIRRPPSRVSLTVTRFVTVTPCSFYPDEVAS